jgi:N-methylhydantoinase A
MPGPACYGRGGTEPAVTDANLALGRYDPARFAGGTMALDVAAAERALDRAVGAPLGLDAGSAAGGVIEMVDETMANAARIHAIESGKTFEGRTVIAFGGGGPVHACRVAEKIGATRIIVPPGAGVGSAIGFLRAPVGYEVVRSQYARLSRFDAVAADALLAEMAAEAATVVEPGRFGAPVVTSRTAFMRYVGQGHEIPVRLAAGPLDPDALRPAFDAAYAAFYDRPVPGSDVEVMSYAVTVATEPSAWTDEIAPARAAAPLRTQPVRDPLSGEVVPWPVHDRAAMAPGTVVLGPAIIAEDETSTLVGAAWTAAVDAAGNLVLKRQSPDTSKSASNG